MKRSLQLLFVFLLVITLSSCGGRSNHSLLLDNSSQTGTRSESGIEIDFESYQVLPPRPPRSYEIPDGTGIVESGFELIMLDDKSYPDPSMSEEFELDVREAPEGVSVTVLAVNAGETTSAFFHLKYDSERFSPSDVKIGSFLGGDDEIISLAVTRADAVSVGIARILPDENGAVSGSGVIASVNFSNEPYRIPAINPYPDTSKSWNKVVTLDAVDNQNNSVTLTWLETNLGDYDNSGEVTIADVAKVALHYLHEKDAEEFFPDEFDALIDGSKDGGITIADVAPIASNYLHRIVGYNIYRTAYTEGVDPVFGPEDLIENPINPLAEATVTRDAILSGGDPPPQVLTYLFIDNLEVGGDYAYIVRPVSAPEDNPPEGLDSDWAAVNAEISTKIEFGTERPEYLVGDQLVLEIRLLEGMNVFSTNVRFDYDPALLEYVEIVASLDAPNPNYFPDSFFFGVEVDENTIGFNNTEKKGQSGVDGNGVLAYAVFNTLAPGEAVFSFHNPTNFVYLRSPDPDFETNKLLFKVLENLTVTILPTS